MSVNCSLSVPLLKQEENEKPSGLEDKNGSSQVRSGWLDRPYKVLLPLKGWGEKKEKKVQLS